MAVGAADRVIANRYAHKIALGRTELGTVWGAQDMLLGREVMVREIVLPTWLATAVTLGSSRRAWKTRRARSCDSTKRCTGSGLPGSQDRPALTAARAIARSARGLVALLRDSTSR
jgi:hypothetical protein